MTLQFDHAYTDPWTVPIDAVTGARGSQIGFARANPIAGAVQLTLTALLLAVVVEVAVRDLTSPSARCWWSRSCSRVWSRR